MVPRQLTMGRHHVILLYIHSVHNLFEHALLCSLSLSFSLVSLSVCRPQTYWGIVQLYVTVLVILYVVLSITPECSLPSIISVIWYDIIGYPLDEIVFVSILVLLSIVCARSFLMQLTSKPKDMEFRTLFYESLFGKQSRVLKSPFPILTLIAVPLSVWYIWTIVTYAYYNWEIKFAQFFHSLQLYPAVFFFFQTLFQGSFLLWTFSVPSFAQKLKEQTTFASDIREYINTNSVLLIHSISLIVIVLKNEIPVPNFDNLVVGEILYRSLALVAFFSLKLKMNRKTTQSAIEDTDQNQPFPNMIEPVETSEKGYTLSEYVGHGLLQNSNMTQPAIKDTQQSRNMIVPMETSETRYTSEYVGHGFLLNISTQNTASTNTGSSSLSESPSCFISAESVSSRYEEDTVPPSTLDRVHEQCTDKNTTIPHRGNICFTPSY